SSFPVSRVLMRLSMGIDAARAAESRRKVEAAIDRIEHELQPSGYLVGDAFSVADLTAAALLSPVVLPREFPYVFPSPLPESVQRYRDSLAGRRAGAWTEGMYRRHRGLSARDLAARLRPMARNNAWSNPRLHGACARLTPDELRATRTSFFPSLW